MLCLRKIGLAQSTPPQKKDPFLDILNCQRRKSKSNSCLSTELTMHSGVISDNERWELSYLGGLCQAGATYWTLGSMYFPLLVQFRLLLCQNHVTAPTQT